VIPDNERGKYVDPDDYTNGKAARFWATDVRYMNDTLELRFGLDIVSERLLEASSDESFASALRKAFAGFAAVFDPDHLFSWPFRCCSVCFCESGDLLSQWRGYAGGVGGFAIGFPREVRLTHLRALISEMPDGTRADRSAQLAAQAGIHRLEALRQWLTQACEQVQEWERQDHAAPES